MTTSLQDMKTCQIDGVSVFVSCAEGTDVEVTTDELLAYVKRGREKYPNTTLDSIKLNFDGEFVDIEYKTAAVPFDRIRRITGYLVGTLDRFNDAKRSEESDRVKHAVSA